MLIHVPRRNAASKPILVRRHHDSQMPPFPADRNANPSGPDDFRPSQGAATLAAGRVTPRRADGLSVNAPLISLSQSNGGPTGAAFALLPGGHRPSSEHAARTDRAVSGEKLNWARLALAAACAEVRSGTAAGHGDGDPHADHGQSAGPADDGEAARGPGEPGSQLTRRDRPRAVGHQSDRDRHQPE